MKKSKIFGIKPAKAIPKPAKVKIPKMSKAKTPKAGGIVAIPDAKPAVKPEATPAPQGLNVMSTAEFINKRNKG